MADNTNNTEAKTTAEEKAKEANSSLSKYIDSVSDDTTNHVVTLSIGTLFGYLGAKALDGDLPGLGE